MEPVRAPTLKKFIPAALASVPKNYLEDLESHRERLCIWGLPPLESYDITRKRHVSVYRAAGSYPVTYGNIYGQK